MLTRIIDLSLNLIASPIEPQDFPYPIYLCNRDSIIEKILFDFSYSLNDYDNINYAFWKIINKGNNGQGNVIVNWITNNPDYPLNHTSMEAYSSVILLNDYKITNGDVLLFDKEYFGDESYTDTGKSVITIFERRL